MPEPIAAAEPSDRALYRVMGDAVERVRAGDQVAMALLIETRKAAARGNERARRSLALGFRYLDENPPQHFGGTKAENSPEVVRLWSLHLVEPGAAKSALLKDLGRVSYWQAVCALVHVPVTVLEGVTFPENLSKIVPLAASIRAIANPEVPLAAFCPVVAWELGEE